MMNELQKILTWHYKTYPAMQSADFVKLLYQNEFGGRHMAYHEQESLDALSLERTLPAAGEKAETSFENIGNGMCRMYFSGCASGEITTETLNRFFIASANSISGNKENLEIKLQFLEMLCADGILSFPKEELAAYLGRYRQAQYPSVSHSELYKKKYSPAYRVVCLGYRDYFPLFSRIDRMLSVQNTVTVAIEGGCCAGKTSLANLLQTVYNCSIIHMDDFFLPAELRTAARLNEKGGNIDYERFRREITPGVTAGKPFYYRKYDCRTGKLTDRIQVAPKRLYVIEGVYSMHPRLELNYDIPVFLHISHEEQARRVLLREPPEKQRRFFNEWIPKEDIYFQEFKPSCRCSMHFTAHDTQGL